MYIVTTNLETFGAFMTRKAAEYFVSELPSQYTTCRVEVLQSIESMGIDPATGDGTYRHFMDK